MSGTAFSASDGWYIIRASVCMTDTAYGYGKMSGVISPDGVRAWKTVTTVVAIVGLDEKRRHSVFETQSFARFRDSN